jgi:hypothetical protein
MKKILCVLLCVLLLCGCGAPAAEIEPTTTAPTEAPLEMEALSDGKTLKMLAIGNSFSNNTTKYLYDIAKAEGVENIVLGRLYIGGCSLQKHVNCATHNTFEYTYYKNTTGAWEKMENVNLLHGLQDEQWDIITMQQQSGRSGLPDSYDPYLGELIEYVNTNKTNPNAKLVWHMTWAYQQDCTQSGFANYANSQDVMYQGIVEATQQKILTNDAFSGMIPAGTAVQNVRTSYIGDNLTADGYHLNNLGEFIGGYTWYATFVGKPLDSIKMDQVPGSISLNDQTKALIIECVNNALKNPLEVTESAYK